MAMSLGVSEEAEICNTFHLVLSDVNLIRFPMLSDQSGAL
jgi:hypothetical protein